MLHRVSKWWSPPNKVANNHFYEANRGYTSNSAERRLEALLETGQQYVASVSGYNLITTP
jgi:hypothetical protein